MNAQTKKIFNFVQTVWGKYKLQIVLVSILLVASMTAMCATCGSC